MQFSIVPGAVVPAVAIERKSEGKINNYQRRAIFLPEQGGVGQVPLPILHQGLLPICTGVAAANARSILYYQQTGSMIPFSGLFIYKMNRLFDGLSPDIKGSTLEASMQTLAYKGVCPEWRYPSNPANCSRAFPRNGRSLLQWALPYRVRRYARCQCLQDVLEALSEQYPVVFSMIIYTDFYEAKRGIVAGKRQGRRIGGHSMVAINYDLRRELVQVVQSWGKASDGPTDRGYMYIPFSWFDLIDDLTGHTLLIEAFALQE